MSSWDAIAGLTCATAVLLAIPRPTVAGALDPVLAPDASLPHVDSRERSARSGPVVIGVVVGCAAWWMVGGALGLVIAGALTAVVIRKLVTRQPAGAARALACERRELPGFVVLVAAALQAGAAPEVAVRHVCRALPGPTAHRFGPALGRLALGIDPVTVWSDVAADPVLGPLGRALSRAAQVGAPVREVIDRLAHDLAQQARLETEDAARTVGVRAAVPLGLCLLPAFLLLGIVPLAAGLFGSALA